MSDKLTWRQAAEATKELLNSMTRERDELRAELAQERNERDATADMLREARAEVERLREERDNAIDAEKIALREIGAEVERLQLALEAIAEYESPEGHIAREALARPKE